MKKLFLFLTISFMFLIVGCGFGNDTNNTSTSEEAEAEGSDGTTIDLMEASEIPTLDSSHAHDSVGFSTLNNINEGLYRGDENHEPELALAEEHDVNDDETVHTFTLRDANWSNGEKVTANDFEYAWKRTLDVSGHYSDMFVTANVKNAQAILDEEMGSEDLGVEAIDENTLEVTLESPNPLFKQLLTFPTFFPLYESFVEDEGEQYGTEADKVLFNGAFVLDSWEHDQGWVLKKNEDYWDAETVNIDKINVNIVKEASTGVNLWETDELDRVELSSSYVDEYESDDSYFTEERPSIVFMRVNHNEEAFQNEKIRKSLDMAIDKEGLTDTILNDGSKPLNGLVPKDFSFSPDDNEDFRDINGEYNEGSKEDAQNLFEEGLSEIDEDSLSFELTVSDDEAHQKTAEFIKNQLETNLSEITIEIKKVPFEARLEQEKAVDYDMVISTWGPDYNDPMTFLDMWTTNGTANRMDFSDEKYDELITNAREETDETKRYEKLLEAEDKLMKEAHIIPLFQDVDALLMRQNIEGMLRHPAAPEFDYKGIEVK
ncbi:MAG TPA: peptide ABC transporter substrate-binding protein [Pseudogracilibacillus sp.]|nr:peptide ABC transporter substrate-binding protein [Pseudogracilibacillus sp.]